MRKRMVTVSRNSAILEEPEQTISFKITACKHKLQKIQIMNWGANKEKLIEKRKWYGKAQTILTVV